MKMEDYITARPMNRRALSCSGEAHSWKDLVCTANSEWLLETSQVRHSPDTWASTSKHKSSCRPTTRAVHTPMFVFLVRSRFRGFFLSGSDALAGFSVRGSPASGAFEYQQRDMPAHLAGVTSARVNVKIAGVSLREEHQGQNLLLKPSSRRPHTEKE